MGGDSPCRFKTAWEESKGDEEKNTHTHTYKNERTDAKEAKRESHRLEKNSHMQSREWTEPRRRGVFL